MASSGRPRDVTNVSIMLGSDFVPAWCFLLINIDIGIMQGVKIGLDNYRNLSLISSALICMRFVVVSLYSNVNLH